ncbi:hypothetical protein [Streptomyces sp. NPDC054838]
MTGEEGASITVQGPWAHPDHVRAVHYALEGQDCLTWRIAECFFEGQARKAIDALKAWEACHDSFRAPGNDFDIVIDPNSQTVVAHAVTLHRLRRHLPFPRGHVVITGHGNYGDFPLVEDNSMRPGLVHFRASSPAPDTDKEHSP